MGVKEKFLELGIEKVVKPIAKKLTKPKAKVKKAVGVVSKKSAKALDKEIADIKAARRKGDISDFTSDRPIKKVIKEREAIKGLETLDSSLATAHNVVTKSTGVVTKTELRTKLEKAGVTKALQKELGIDKQIKKYKGKVNLESFAKRTSKMIETAKPASAAVRKQRATAQGVAAKRFHGTKKDLTEIKPSKDGRFGPGVYLEDDPARASGYAMGRKAIIGEQREGANVIPVVVKGEPDLKYGTESVVRDPARIRSVNAQFNPDRTSSKNLLATAVTATVAGAALTTSTDSEAGLASTMVTIAKHAISADSTEIVSTNKSAYDKPITDALANGYGATDVLNYLVSDKGLTRVQAADEMTIVATNRVAEAFGQGKYSAQEITEYMLESGWPEAVVKRAMPQNTWLEKYWKGMGKVALDVFASYGEAKTAEQLAARSKALHNRYSTILKSVGGFWDQELRMEAHKDLADLDAQVIAMLKENGIEAERVKIAPEAYDIYYKNREGQQQKLDTSMIQEIMAERGELAAGLAGFGAGFAGSKGNWLAKTAGGIAASTAAVVVGGAIDITRNAFQTREELSAKLYQDKLTDLAVMNIALAGVGSTVAKIGSETAKAVYRAYDYVLGGRMEAAASELMKILGMDKDQAMEVVAQFNKHAEKDLTGRDATKIIAALSRTHPEADSVVAAPLSSSVMASANIARELDARAKDILAKVTGNTSASTSSVLRQDLAKYEETVKDTYGAVKELAATELRKSDYKFNYDELAIEPILSRINSQLTNKDMRETALLFLERVRSIGGKKVKLSTTQPVKESYEVVRPMRRGGAKPETRTRTVEKEVESSVVVPTLRSFDDLMDLNLVVNKLSREPFITKNYKDKELIIDIQRRVQAEIKRAVTDTMDDADSWLKLWKDANMEYGKMFDLRKNVLVKAITSDGITIDSAITKVLMRASQTNNAVFRDVLNAIPRKRVPAVENAVLEGFVRKNTIGVDSASQAIDFPVLAEQLSHVKLVSPEARELKRVITDLADVFKVDKQIMKALGSMRSSGNTNTIATTIHGKAAAETVSRVWDYIRRLSPLEGGRQAALNIQLGKALRTPQHAKTVDKLIAMLPKDPVLRNRLRMQLLNLAKFGEKSTYPEVEMYRAAPKGRTKAKSDGSIGTGTYYFTSKSDAIARSKRTNAKVITEKVDPDLIADEIDIQRILGVDNVTTDMIRNNPSLQERLKLRYQGLIIDNEIVIF